jgi:hypothetical protein
VYSKALKKATCPPGKYEKVFPAQGFQKIQKRFKKRWSK